MKEKSRKVVGTLFVGVLLLVFVWIGWGFGVFFLANSFGVKFKTIESGLTAIGNFSNGFSMLASLVTSITVITASIQFLNSNEESKALLKALETTAKSQTLISRSSQIELMFASYIDKYLDELSKGLNLWGEKCTSVHAIRNVITKKYEEYRSNGGDYSQYLAALNNLDDTANSGVYRRAADALSHELEVMGSKCLAGAVPAGVLICGMGGHWAIQWLICSPLIKQHWNKAGVWTQSKGADGNLCKIGFSRRHGYWLAIFSALYSLKNWPVGQHNVWANELISHEFNSSKDEAYSMMWALYNCDKDFYGENIDLEAMMKSIK